MWLNVSKENANNENYVPPRAFYSSKIKVEYYPYDFFGIKKDFTEKTKIQYRRKQKIERIIIQ